MTWKICLIYLTAVLVGLLSYIETSSVTIGLGKVIGFIVLAMLMSASGLMGKDLKGWGMLKIIRLIR